MFNKTRIERIFKYLVEDEQHLARHDVEIMVTKAKVGELETEFNRRLNSLKEELLNSDKFVGYLHGCANDNYDLINGLRDRVIKLEEKHCCSECGKCDGACQE